MAHSYLNKKFLYLPLFFTSKAGFNILQIYLYAAIPIAIFNGYSIDGWLGMFIVGIGTWVGMLIANLILRFNPTLQFFLFGSVNISWTIYNTIQLL